MIHLTGTLIVPEQDREMVGALLPAHIAATRVELGCLQFDVVPDRSDPGRYLVAERFTDRAAFDAHQTRGKASVWGKATAHLERHFQLSETTG